MEISKYVLFLGLFLVIGVSLVMAYVTPWLDRDDPSGDGDWEAYGQFGNPCMNMTLNYTEIGCVSGSCYDDIIHMATGGGMYCLNAEQLNRTNSTCGDWKVKFYCN